MYINQMRTLWCDYCKRGDTTTSNKGQSRALVYHYRWPVKTGSTQMSLCFWGLVYWGRFNYVTNQYQTRLCCHCKIYRRFPFYMVSFVDGDNNIIEVQKVFKGNDAVYPKFNTPGKTKLDDILYIFKGYDRGLTDISSDVTITALFDAVDRYHDVILWCA